MGSAPSASAPTQIPKQITVRKRRERETSRKEEERSPQRLILIRHGESEGNIDHDLFRTKPDNAMHLTRQGFLQAEAAGRSLKELIGDTSVRFFVSPYVRTRETLNGIVKSWGGLEHVKWSEDPRLREQDFGNFQDPEVMRKCRADRNKFGRFYYRFPDGESGADVYDRVSSFLESLWRYWALHDEYSNYVLVTHGLTIQVFLMRWFKADVDEFHRHKNFSNCEYCVLEKQDGRFKLAFIHELTDDLASVGVDHYELRDLPEEYHHPRQINIECPSPEL